MNGKHPEPLTFPAASSRKDTQEACRRYKVKPPTLNADFLETLLKKTQIEPDLQASIIRGWREGFDLGSHLPQQNHFAADSKFRSEEQNSYLKKGLEKEKAQGRIHGPIKKPYHDGR